MEYWEVINEAIARLRGRKNRPDVDNILSILNKKKPTISKNALEDALTQLEKHNKLYRVYYKGHTSYRQTAFKDSGLEVPVSQDKPPGSQNGGSFTSDTEEDTDDKSEPFVSRSIADEDVSQDTVVTPTALDDALQDRSQSVISSDSDSMLDQLSSSSSAARRRKRPYADVDPAAAKLDGPPKSISSMKARPAAGPLPLLAARVSSRKRIKKTHGPDWQTDALHLECKVQLSTCAVCRSKDVSGNLLSCSACKVHVHAACLQLTERSVAKISANKQFYCLRCKPCKLCHYAFEVSERSERSQTTTTTAAGAALSLASIMEGGDMIHCCQCYSVFHLGCLRPALSVKPKGQPWMCRKCSYEANKKEKLKANAAATAMLMVAQQRPLIPDKSDREVRSCSDEKDGDEDDDDDNNDDGEENEDALVVASASERKDDSISPSGRRPDGGGFVANNENSQLLRNGHSTTVVGSASTTSKAASSQVAAFTSTNQSHQTSTALRSNVRSGAGCSGDGESSAASSGLPQRGDASSSTGSRSRSSAENSNNNGNSSSSVSNNDDNNDDDIIIINNSSIINKSISSISIKNNNNNNDASNIKTSGSTTRNNKNSKNSNSSSSSSGNRSSNRNSNNNNSLLSRVANGGTATGNRTAVIVSNAASNGSTCSSASKNGSNNNNNNNNHTNNNDNNNIKNTAKNSSSSSNNHNNNKNVKNGYGGGGGGRNNNNNHTSSSSSNNNNNNNGAVPNNDTSTNTANSDNLCYNNEHVTTKRVVIKEEKSSERRKTSELRKKLFEISPPLASSTNNSSSHNNDKLNNATAEVIKDDKSQLSKAVKSEEHGRQLVFIAGKGQPNPKIRALLPTMSRRELALHMPRQVTVSKSLDASALTSASVTGGANPACGSSSSSSGSGGGGLHQVTVTTTGGRGSGARTSASAGVATTAANLDSPMTGKSAEATPTTGTLMIAVQTTTTTSTVVTSPSTLSWCTSKMAVVNTTTATTTSACSTTATPNSVPVITTATGSTASLMPIVLTSIAKSQATTSINEERMLAGHATMIPAAAMCAGGGGGSSGVGGLLGGALLDTTGKTSSSSPRMTAASCSFPQIQIVPVSLGVSLATGVTVASVSGGGATAAAVGMSGLGTLVPTTSYVTGAHATTATLPQAATAVTTTFSSPQFLQQQQQRQSATTTSLCSSTTPSTFPLSLVESAGPAEPEPPAAVSTTTLNCRMIASERDDKQLHEETKGVRRRLSQFAVHYPNVSGWNAEQVAQFLADIGYEKEAKVFVEQEIDGASLLLLKRADVLNTLGLKLGPAVKIFRHIHNLQEVVSP